MGFFIILYLAISLLNNTNGDGLALLLSALFFFTLLGRT